MIDTYVSQVHYWRHLEPIVEQAHRSPAISGRVFGTREEWNRGRGWPSLARGADVAPLVLVAGYQDALAVERVGRWPILLEHGSGQTYLEARYHPSYPGGEMRDHVRLFLCTNDVVAQANATRYPDIPTAVIGSPLLDDLDRLRREERVMSEVGAPVLGLAWHWPCRISPEAGWAFPEWWPAMAELVERWPGPVFGHAHPRSLLRAAAWYERVGIEVCPDWREMVRRCDVISVDNSSVLFEAAALEIPVVLVNSNRWRREVDHGLRFWEYVEIGPNVWPKVNPDPRADGAAWCEAAWTAYDETHRFEGYAHDMAEQLYPHRGKAVEVAVEALETFVAQVPA